MEGSTDIGGKNARLRLAVRRRKRFQRDAIRILETEDCAIGCVDDRTECDPLAAKILRPGVEVDPRSNGEGDVIQTRELRRERGEVTVRVLTEPDADLRTGQDAERELDAVLVNALAQRLPAKHVGVPLLAAPEIGDRERNVREPCEV